MKKRVREAYENLKQAEDMLEKCDKELDAACREMELSQPLWAIYQGTPLRTKPVCIYSDMDLALEQLRKTGGKRVSLDNGKTYYRLVFERTYSIPARLVPDMDASLDFIIEDDALDQQQKQ